MHIIPGDFSDARIIELLRVHLATARAQTPPESVHALDLTGLQVPEIDFWAMWDGEALVGVGALKTLSAEHGEVKSMHVAAARRRSGAGSAMLRHIIAAAGAKGFARLSLETGSSHHFAPARALYARHGFVACPPFPPYGEDPNSAFMTLDLTPARG